MTMRVKLFILFLFTFAVFAGSLIWRADHLLLGDQLQKNENQVGLQLSAVVDALDFELQGLNQLLILSQNELKTPGQEYASSSPMAKFQVMGVLNAVENEWQISSIHYLQNSEVKPWASTYLTLALKALKSSDFALGSVQVFSISDPKRKPFLLLIHRHVRQWYFGIAGVDVFQKIMDRQKNQLHSVYIVNQKGQALGHTTSEYVGKLLSEDPLVAEIMKSAAPAGSKVFNDLRQEKIQGQFEKVPLSNLFIVMTTPWNLLMSGALDFKIQIGLLALGVLLVSLAMLAWVSKSIHLQSLQSSAPKFGTPGALAVPDKGPSASDKMSAYTKVASSLSLELKSPLTSILGHVQLALGSAADPKLAEHLQRIEHEARIARDLIQKLMVFSGEDKMKIDSGSLDVVLNKALKNLEGRFKVKGIKVTKNIQTIPPFVMPTDLMCKAIENILVNSIEAMERAPQKNLEVNLELVGTDAVLRISDTGEGISAEKIDQVFDPFFTTKSGTQHVGLGLSTARGIFKEASGEIFVESTVGQGTFVKVVFRPQEASLAAAEKPSAAVLAAPVDEDRTVISATSEALSSRSTEPLLVDNTIEQLIDGKEPEEISLLQQRKVSEEMTQVLPPKPLSEFHEKQVVAPHENKIDNGNGAIPLEAVVTSALSLKSAKINKPNIAVKRKTSRLDEEPISVRRPGEKT